MTGNLHRRIARKMAWLSSRFAAIDRPLQRIWILAALPASGILLVLMPSLDALPS